MMNKKFGMFLVMVLCAVLATGCGKKEETPVVDNNVETEAETPATDDKQEEVTDTETETEENVDEQQPAEDTEENTEDTTTESEENTESQEPEVQEPAEDTQEPEVEQPEVEDTQTPEVQEPEVEEPTEQPETDAPVAGDVVLADIFEAVKNSYEYFAADMLMNASNPDELAMIDMMVWVPNENGDGVGLSADLYDEYVAAVPMIGFNPDIFLAVKAKDGKLADVQAFMESLKAQKNDPMNNYPSNLPRQQAIRIETYGNYVFFYTVGMPNDTETDEATLLEYYNEQNQIASDVIAGFFK